MGYIKEFSEIVGKKKKVVSSAIYGSKPNVGLNSRNEFILDPSSTGHINNDDRIRWSIIELQKEK